MHTNFRNTSLQINKDRQTDKPMTFKLLFTSFDTDVCKDKYDADISTLAAKFELLSGSHSKLEGTVNDLSSTLNSHSSGMVN